jgi:Uncharacterised protein, DegV family COG1307
MTNPRPWILNLALGWLVLVCFSTLALFPAQTQAALIESRLADGGLASVRAVETETIRLALEKQIVAQRLADYGISASEVMAKLPTLSDEQVHQLASLSDDLAAGGVLGEVIAVLLIILLVVVILRLMDKKIIVK